METPSPEPHPAAPPRSAGRRRGRPALRIVLLGLFGLAVLLVIGIVPRVQRHTELAEAVKVAKSSALVVTVVRPTPGARTADFMLPGSIQAIQEASIYSRVDGYLKRRLVDIGDRVQSGQVLAE